MAFNLNPPVFKYKCRMCGLIYDGAKIISGDIVDNLYTICMGGMSLGEPQRALNQHKCDNGNYGIADLIGVVSFKSKIP